MSEDNSNPNGSSGSDTEASGESKPGFVKHDSYVKAVNEAKSAKARLADANARLAEIETQEKARQEQILLDEKNYTEIIAQKNAEIEKLSGEVNTHVKDKQDFRKMNAAIGLLQQKGITLDPKYMDLLPIDQIAISQESGEVVADSVVNVVENFQKEHPRLVTPLGKLLPNQKPGQGLGKISINEYKNLSREEKIKALKDGRVDAPGLVTGKGRR
jgi:hypothetical protein